MKAMYSNYVLPSGHIPSWIQIDSRLQSADHAAMLVCSIYPRQLTVRHTDLTDMTVLTANILPLSLNA